MKASTSPISDLTKKPTQHFSLEAKAVLIKRKDMNASGHHCQGGGVWH